MWLSKYCPGCGRELQESEDGAWCEKRCFSRGSFQAPTMTELFERKGFSYRTGRWDPKVWREGWDR